MPEMVLINLKLYLGFCLLHYFMNKRCKYNKDKNRKKKINRGERVPFLRSKVGLRFTKRTGFSIVTASLDMSEIIGACNDYFVLPKHIPSMKAIKLLYARQQPSRGLTHVAFHVIRP